MEGNKNQSVTGWGAWSTACTGLGEGRERPAEVTLRHASPRAGGLEGQSRWREELEQPRRAASWRNCEHISTARAREGHGGKASGEDVEGAHERPGPRESWVSLGQLVIISLNNGEPPERRRRRLGK